jgi:uncharacterized membrane protein YccC
MRLPNWLRPMFTFDFAKMDLWVALRGSVGIVIALTVGLLIGKPAAGLLVGLGALVVSYSDGPDPYRYRARRLLASTVLCGAAVFLGAESIRIHVVLAGALAACWAFAAGMAVLFGATAADLGAFSLVMFIIFAVEPLSSERALTYSGLILAGGFLQTGLSLILWSLRRYEPERRELGKLFIELAGLGTFLTRPQDVPAASAQMNRAQHTLAGLVRDGSIEGDRYRSLLSQAERCRLALLALSHGEARIREEGEASAEVLARFRAAAARLLGLIGQTLLTDETAEHASAVARKVGERLQDLRDWNALEPSEAGSSALFQAEALAGQLRTALELAGRTTRIGSTEFYMREAGRPWRLRYAGTAATLRANLTLHSTAFRHAVRLAVAIAIGEALSRVTGLQRAYWLPMTVAIVLKPEYSETLQRGILRIVGTIVGLLIATALFHFIHGDPLTEIALAAVFMFFLRWIGTAHYGLFAMALSGLVVLLIAFTGVEPGTLIWARGINTILGGGVALITYFLWPTWEKTHLRETIAGMLDAYRGYFHAVAQVDVAAEGQLDSTRLQGRIARSNLMASLARFETEPARTSEAMEMSIQLRAIQASSNRFAHSVMALEAVGAGSMSEEGRLAWNAFVGDVVHTLSLLATTLRKHGDPNPPFPDLRQAYALFASAVGNAATQVFVRGEADRATNSLNTLREQILSLRWTALSHPG